MLRSGVTSMVQAQFHSCLMLSFHAAMELRMWHLMVAGYIHGFTGALACISEEALVEAGVEA